MTSFGFFLLAFIASLVIRASELWIHNKHERWMMAQGGKNHHGRRFLVYFTATILLPGLALIEYAQGWTPRLPIFIVLGLFFVLGGLLLRLWAMRTLGPFWSVSNMKISGYDKRLNIGPYRWFARPEMWGWLFEATGLGLILAAPGSVAINSLILLLLMQYCLRSDGDLVEWAEFPIFDVISKR